MEPLCFTVIGEPVSKGSMVAGIARKRDGTPYGFVREDNAGVKERNAKGIANAALAARSDAGAGLLHGEALAVTIRFYTRRPKGHYGTGRNAGILKDGMPARPAKKPDVDKWSRHLLDALTGVIYADDGQVVTLLAEKRYAEGDEVARTEVEVAVIPQQSVGVVVPVEQLALAA